MRIGCRVPNGVMLYDIRLNGPYQAKFDARGKAQPGLNEPPILNVCSGSIDSTAELKGPYGVTVVPDHLWKSWSKAFADSHLVINKQVFVVGP